MKFLGKLEASITDQETREGWWEELRDEIKGHAKTMCCNHIIGYSETCTVFGEVCLLSASGTAAKLKRSTFPTVLMSEEDGDADDSDNDGGADKGGDPRSHRKGMSVRGSNSSFNTSSRFSQAFNDRRRDSAIESAADGTRNRRAKREISPCYSVHVPYKYNEAPFSFMRLVPCCSCGKAWVPETILSTTEPSHALAIRSHGQLMEARVCRTRQSSTTGETDAVYISNVLPFVEFQIQRQIMFKLKVLGLNAAFGYSSNIQVGRDIVVATATCTAVYLEALPPPRLQLFHIPQKLHKMKEDIEELYKSNMELLSNVPIESDKSSSDSDTSSSSSSGGSGDDTSLESPSSSEESDYPEGGESDDENVVGGQNTLSAAVVSPKD